eukprot:1195851-Prorocentrum_minimum.AAC.4
MTPQPNKVFDRFAISELRTRGGVAQHERHAVARLGPPERQEGGQLARPRAQPAIGESQSACNYRTSTVFSPYVHHICRNFHRIGQRWNIQGEEVCVQPTSGALAPSRASSSRRSRRRGSGAQSAALASASTSSSSAATAVATTRSARVRASKPALYMRWPRAAPRRVRCPRPSHRSNAASGRGSISASPAELPAWEAATQLKATCGNNQSKTISLLKRSASSGASRRNFYPAFAVGWSVGRPAERVGSPGRGTNQKRLSNGVFGEIISPQRDLGSPAQNQRIGRRRSASEHNPKRRTADLPPDPLILRSGGHLTWAGLPRSLWGDILSLKTPFERLLQVVSCNAIHLSTHTIYTHVIQTHLIYASRTVNSGLDVPPGAARPGQMCRTRSARGTCGARRAAWHAACTARAAAESACPGSSSHRTGRSAA